MGDAERCPSTRPDPTTPSGLTRCMQDVGHEGLHFHINAGRTRRWQDCPHCGGPMAVSTGHLCFGGGKGGTFTDWYCPSTECRAARYDAAIAAAVKVGIVDG